jgi:murein L,D-transpeptidase YafK
MRVLGVILFFVGVQAFAQSNRCEWLNQISIENPPEKLTEKIDYILVGKAQRRLIVFSHGVPQKDYRIHLGFTPEGPKRFEGDGKTPEGLYAVAFRKSPSDYTKSLMLDYPRKKDIEYARRFRKNAGKEIAIHGFPRNPKELAETLPKIEQGLDWTQGCMALTNTEIEEIFPLVAAKTPVEICP